MHNIDKDKVPDPPSKMHKVVKYNQLHSVWGSSNREVPKQDEIHVIHKDTVDGEVLAVDFKCPCGCGSGGWTPIVSSQYGTRTDHPRPLWDWMTGGNMINPSVRYLSGCKSHFWIRADGTVVWC